MQTHLPNTLKIEAHTIREPDTQDFDFMLFKSSWNGETRWPAIHQLFVTTVLYPIGIILIYQQEYPHRDTGTLHPLHPRER